MMQGGAGSFLRRWTIAITLALLFGYVLYTPIAHGLTGSHAHGVNALQFLAHSLALAVVAVSVAAAQRHELRRYVAVPWTRLPLAVIGFIAAFWAGVYQPWLHGPDYDILFGSFVLGSAVFIGVVPARGHPRAFTIAVLVFPVACFLGQLTIVAAVAAIGFVPDLQGSNLQHSAYWIWVGVSTGAIGGAIGGAALRRMLTMTIRPSGADRRPQAESSSR